MKSIVTLTILLLSVVVATGQTLNPEYDSTLAKTLGADEYGMKMYVLVILKSGTNVIENKSIRDSLFAGHLSNINRMAGLNQLIVAGPFGKNESDFRGIFILNVSSLDDANKLLETDPAIQAKLLKPELYNWYGSAALPEYLKTDDKIWQIKP